MKDLPFTWHGNGSLTERPALNFSRVSIEHADRRPYAINLWHGPSLGIRIHNQMHGIAVRTEVGARSPGSHTASRKNVRFSESERLGEASIWLNYRGPDAPAPDVAAPPVAPPPVAGPVDGPTLGGTRPGVVTLPVADGKPVPLPDVLALEPARVLPGPVTLLGTVPPSVSKVLPGPVVPLEALKGLELVPSSAAPCPPAFVLA
jgi:hypothetical protein